MDKHTYVLDKNRVNGVHSQKQSFILCEVAACVYNKKNKCNALAIIVEGPSPVCDFFFSSENKIPIQYSGGTVGACKVKECAYNQTNECAAPGIHIRLEGGRPACTTHRSKRNESAHTSKNPLYKPSLS